MGCGMAKLSHKSTTFDTKKSTISTHDGSKLMDGNYGENIDDDLEIFTREVYISYINYINIHIFDENFGTYIYTVGFHTSGWKI